MCYSFVGDVFTIGLNHYVYPNLFANLLKFSFIINWRAMSTPSKVSTRPRGMSHKPNLNLQGTVFHQIGPNLLSIWTLSSIPLFICVVLLKFKYLLIDNRHVLLQKKFCWLHRTGQLGAKYHSHGELDVILTRNLGDWLLLNTLLIYFNI